MADLKQPFDRGVIERALDEIHNRMDDALQRRKEMLAQELADRIAASDLPPLSELLVRAPFAWLKTMEIGRPGEAMNSEQMELGVGYNRINLADGYARSGRPIPPGLYRAIVVLLPVKAK